MKEGLLKEGTEQNPDEPADEDMYADDADMAGVTVDMDSRTRITVRNLRIREDTAKYLYNLDPNGPYYDPKSRSMRENPFAVSLKLNINSFMTSAKSYLFSNEIFLQFSKIFFVLISNFIFRLRIWYFIKASLEYARKRERSSEVCR